MTGGTYLDQGHDVRRNEEAKIEEMAEFEESKMDNEDAGQKSVEEEVEPERRI